jgi:hypothetical protein
MKIFAEKLENRTLFAAIPQVAGIGYLLSDGGTKFQRYDIASKRWLSPVTLSGSPGGASAALVDGQGIYMAYGRTVVRYRLDGSAPRHLINTVYPVNNLHSDGNVLFANQSDGLYARFISFNKTTNAIIDSMENYVDSVYGSSISTTNNRIVGCSLGISPSDVTYVTYNDDGSFTGEAGDSPYHGDYSTGDQTWVFPLGSKFVDDTGGVYSVSSFTRLGSFPTTVSDIAFSGSDVPIVLNGSTLSSYTATLLPAGSKQLSSAPSNILVAGDSVIAFTPDASLTNRYSTQIVPLTDLRAPTPGAPTNPVGLTYTPDNIDVAADGTLLILDKETQSIFRWNSVTQTYGATIALIDVPEDATYSSFNNTVYVSYDTGVINKIELGASRPVERPFAVLPSSPFSLAMAGQYLFTGDGSGAWATHYTFAPDGRQVSAVDWNYYSDEYVWSAANSKMYFFRDDTSPNDLLWEEINAAGEIGETRDSPLHGETDFVHPIRVSPDGKLVILGTGNVHDAITLDLKAGGLGNAVSDIAWLQGVVYTVREIAGQVQFQTWNGSTFALGRSVQVAGIPLALLNVANTRMVGVYLNSAGVPQFRVMGPNLQTMTPGTATGSISGLAWNDTDGNGTRNGTELVAANREVYIDTNKNGVKDTGERSTRTDAAGNYRFANLAAGTYRLRTMPLATGQRLSSPVAGWHDVTLGNNASVTGRNFGVTTRSYASGRVFNDANGNRVRDSSEQGLSGWRVFIDANNNGRFDASERSVLTDSAGGFAFVDLLAGTYRFLIQSRTGYTITTPPGGLTTITLGSGQLRTGVMYGVRAGR